MYHHVIATIVTSAVLLSKTPLANETCEGGSVNQQLCQKTCRHNNSCSCAMTQDTSFTSCSQTCHFLSSCPRMTCSGRNACAQKCFFGRCNMKCGSSQFCSQSCVWEARCREITCSSPTCHQICANCTMECTSGVERCEQMCLGGRCDMKCYAHFCKRQCMGKQCNYIGHAMSNAWIAENSFWVLFIASLIKLNI